MSTTMRLMLVLGIATGLSLIAKADQIEFATLPQPAQTTVIRETHIVGPTDVVRVARQTSGVYAVTVRKNPGQAVVYVNNAGEIVRPVNTSTTTQTIVETTEAPTLDTFVHNLDSSRYQVIEKRENEETYLDRQTGVKWKIKVERKD